jgi:hypothetical protein
MASTLQRGAILSKMEAAARYVAEQWNGPEMLGPALAQANGYDAVVSCLHPLPMTMANMILSLHAMNGPLVRIRQQPMTTSFGAVFFHFAKTNKSGMSAVLDEGATALELLVNGVELAKVEAKTLSKDDAQYTYTYFPGASPEAFIEHCDADRDGRTHWGVPGS